MSIKKSARQRTPSRRKQSTSITMHMSTLRFSRSCYCVVVKLFCNICGLNLLDCCLEAIGTVRFYQWCFAPLRGHAIDKICHFRFFAITQSNQETCFRRPLCCCPHLVWCAVTVIAMWAHMIVGSIGEFLHRVIEFLFRPKFVQIRAFVL